MEPNMKSVGYRIWGADDVVYGPVNLPILADWIHDERVTPETWIFSERGETWQKASLIAELQAFFGARSTCEAGDTARVASPLVPGVKPGALRRVKILADMNDQQLGRFAQMMEIQQVRQWTVIVKQGTAGDAMYLVLDGEVRVRLLIGEKETLLTTLSVGDFFGEGSLFDQGMRSADVVANQDSTLLRVSSANFEKLVRESPDLATPFLLAICRTMSARIRADNKRLRDSIALSRASH